MKSYEEIRAILEGELNVARATHESEILNRDRTEKALARAQDRYDRFTLHGMIPDDFNED